MFTSILQPSHIIIVMIVALVFLGPKRLPGAGRALGQGLREFKNSISANPEREQPLAALPSTNDEHENPRADPAQG